MSSSRAGKVIGLGACVAVLVGLTGLVTGGFAKSPSFLAAATKKGFVPVCTQRKGGFESKGDLNIRLKKFCAKGQKPLKLALFPVAAAQGPQ
jgi:hypothetical protein